MSIKLNRYEPFNAYGVTRERTPPSVSELANDVAKFAAALEGAEERLRESERDASTKRIERDEAKRDLAEARKALDDALGGPVR